MKNRERKNVMPYPYNLLEDVFGIGEPIAEMEMPPQDFIDDYLGTLSEREQMILRCRYEQGMTYKDIGTELGISGSRVSQILYVALRRLRHPVRSKDIKRIIDFNRLSEIYDKMDPTECIDYMYETTCFDDEISEYRLDIPEWPYDEYDDDYDPNQIISFTMNNWSKDDRDRVKAEYLQLIDSIKAIASVDGIGETYEENERILGKDLLEVWNTYIRRLDGDEDSPSYGADVRSDAEKRVGKRVAAYDEIIRASRVFVLMTFNAPDIIIKIESQLLAQAMVINRFAKGRIREGEQK